MSATTALRACPAWCKNHDYEADVCLGENIALDFTAEHRLAGLVSGAYVMLSHCTVEGTDISVSFPEHGPAQMGVDDAHRLGLLLLAMVATARRGGTAGA